MTKIRSLAYAMALGTVLVGACSSEDGPRETVQDTEAETKAVVIAVATGSQTIVNIHATDSQRSDESTLSTRLNSR